VGRRALPATTPKCNTCNGKDSYVKTIRKIQVAAEGSEVFNGYRITLGLSRFGWGKLGSTHDNPL